MPRLFFAIALLAAAASVASAQPLSRAEPAAVGLSAAALAEIDTLVAAGIAEKKLPGCVVCVGRRGKLALLKAYGNKRLLPNPEPMTVDTVFDLASLTKPIATATSIMLLAERGKLKLDDKVAAILPRFEVEGKGEITIQHLLTHTSGLLPDNALSDYDDGPAKAIERICQLKLRAPTGSKFIYSDVNFILLGEIIERVGGQSVHDFSQANIFQPLGMRETGYLPPTNLRERCAPTEQRDGRWMQGEVHDPRAHKLGGVAGHAGLFSTAEDLAIYAQMLLSRGRRGEMQILQPETIDLMTRDYAVPRGIRGLGWDKQTGYSINKGQKLSAAAFGHGGFTGTVIWIDPDRELFFIFLSNRLHPSGKGLVNPLAGKIADAIVAAIET
jgi:CubicO group peptidase (beta-lactamase class C family)